MLVYYFVPFIVSNRYLLFWVSNGHKSVTVQNRTHVYMNFFDHKDLGNHLLQLCPKVVKHPVYNGNRVSINLQYIMRIKCYRRYKHSGKCHLVNRQIILGNRLFLSSSFFRVVQEDPPKRRKYVQSQHRRLKTLQTLILLMQCTFNIISTLPRTRI